MIRPFNIIIAAIYLILLSGCVPFDKIHSHEFRTGYYDLKKKGEAPQKVYMELHDDSADMYPVITGKYKLPDTRKIEVIDLELVNPQNSMYDAVFRRTSLDVDLSTVLLKYRPSAGNVPPQLNANVNGSIYAGFRKDFFKLKSSISRLNEMSTSIRHAGFDFGVFAGIGITPVNPTVTMERTVQEYDGIVFQKGIAVFGSYENMSVGIALGFDNLMDRNRSIWIFNNKPWIGIMLGIANF